MKPVYLDALRARVRATRGPQFLLPARFATVSFESYEPDPAFPHQAEALARIAALAAAPPVSRWRWRRAKDPLPRAVYLDGPPGIGKTHLLAAAFHAGPERRLFATFDEFSAAAGTLGMRRLGELLASRHLVCIDEIDLRDPASIMLLVSLMRAMLDGQPRILATANVDPTGVSTGWFPLDDLRRELGEIADAFEILRLDGIDRRASRPHRLAIERIPEAEQRVLTIDWDDLLAFLSETHPMYDAAWLQEVDLIALDRLEPLRDTDEALRFVRFIDRVYDRDVALRVEGPMPSLDEFLAALSQDRRFGLHVARCRSRLSELAYVRRDAGAVAGDA